MCIRFFVFFFFWSLAGKLTVLFFRCGDVTLREQVFRPFFVRFFFLFFITPVLILTFSFFCL